MKKGQRRETLQGVQRDCMRIRRQPKEGKIPGGGKGEGAEAGEGGDEGKGDGAGEGERVDERDCFF